MTTLTSEPLASQLEQMFVQADAPTNPEFRAAVAALSPEERQDPRRFYGLAKDAYLAVSRETAQLLYLLVRSTGARSIVEFGTSFGISTLHLAAGLHDNGGGAIITTEFEPSKAARARENFAAARLAELIELREGDAIETLAVDLPQSIDLVLMDGAKTLYPAVLDRLEPRLRPGSVLIADNADASPEYLERVRSVGYVSVPFAADVELSMRTGD